MARAKKANTSIVWARMRQFLSYASSVSAGMTDYDRDSTPRTLVMRLSFLNKVIRTSESVSFRSVRKMGKMCSDVPFLPSTGDKARIDDAIESYIYMYCITSYEGVGVGLDDFEKGNQFV